MLTIPVPADSDLNPFLETLAPKDGQPADQVGEIVLQSGKKLIVVDESHPLGQMVAARPNK